MDFGSISFKVREMPLNQSIVECTKCPRLVKWCRQVSSEKRAAYLGDDYWGKPVPSFGDLNAALLIVGLAPGAHGANRTGRMFTGDRSGEWLYGALFETGFANQPISVNREDGLSLIQARISAIVHCAPPLNKPTIDERDRCLPFLSEEMRLMTRLSVVVALGGFAWDGVLRALKVLGMVAQPKPKFGHGAEAKVGSYHLLGSYHPSQQNTFTGKLTREMLREVFDLARTRIES